MNSVSRREVTRCELAWLALGSCLLAVVMSWPLVLHLGETIPKDLGDPLSQAWQVAWGGHALADQPLHMFQSNQFWPFDDTLAFSDALIGYAPAGLIGSGPEAAVARYDLLFLFAYALAFAGSYLLARELGLGPAAALVTGAAFAFAPFRLEQDGHMHVISSGGIPLALALGARGLRRSSPAAMLGGWLVATWQLSLGFTLGLPLAYLLALLCAIAAIVWWRRGRPPPDRRLVAAAAVGATVFVAVAALISLPYQRVADEHPQAKRPPSTVEAYSGPVAVFLVAPDENLVWGGATSSLREDVSNPQEKTLFPGLLTVALAIVGLGWPGLSRALRVGLAVAIVGISILALGFQEDDGLLWPYRFVYEVLPGWEAIRTPGRLVTFSSLALALLAGAGVERIRAHGRPAPALALALGALLALTIAIEGRGLPFDPGDSQAQPRAPEAPIPFASVAAPQLHLPATDPEDNRRYLLWSTDGFEVMVNGRSSTQPTFTVELIERMDSFPSPPTVAELRELGVAAVVLHTRRTRGTRLENAASRPIAGLGVGRERRGEAIVYEIRSPSASSPLSRRRAERSARRSR